MAVNVDDDPTSQVPSADASNLTKSPMFTSRARGNLLRQHEEQFEHLPEDLQIIKDCDDAGFLRNVSPRQFSVIIHNAHLAGYCCTRSCREYSHPQMIQDPNRKDFSEETPELVWYWKSKLQNILTVMELKSRSILCTQKETNPAVSTNT